MAIITELTEDRAGAGSEGPGLASQLRFSLCCSLLQASALVHETEMVQHLLCRAAGRVRGRRGGVWPSQCLVNAPSSLHTPLQGLPYCGTQQKHQPKPDPHKQTGFVSVIAVVSAANVPKSTPALHTHHAAAFPMPVKTIGLSASLLTGNASSDEKGALFLSWDRRSSCLLPVTLPGSREVSSLLTAFRDGLLLHTNAFAKTFQ